MCLSLAFKDFLAGDQKISLKIQPNTMHALKTSQGRFHEKSSCPFRFCPNYLEPNPPPPPPIWTTCTTFMHPNVPKNWAGVSPLIWTKFKRTATFFVKPSLMPVVPEERFCDKSYFQFFIRWLIFLYSLYNLAQL